MTESSIKSKKLYWKRIARGAFVFVFWIGLWALLACIVDKEVLLPTPLTVARTLVHYFVLPSFWVSIAASIVRVLIGYAVGCAIGLLLAVICFKSCVLNALFSPVLSVIRAVPVASFIILALVWIGRTNVPSFTSFLMVLPIVAGNALTGLRAADKDLLEVCKLYRFSFGKTVRTLYLPALKPYFLTAARTSLGLSWKAGIAAEVLCSLSASIGGQIYEAKVYLETPSLFAWTITVIFLSMLIESLIFKLPVFKTADTVQKERE